MKCDMKNTKTKMNFIAIYGAIYLVISLVTFILTFSLSQQLLDPFYPTFVSSKPGYIISFSNICLLVSTILTVLSHYKMVIWKSQINALLIVGSTFCFCFSSTTFSMVYGSSTIYETESKNIYHNSILFCKTDQILCDQFKQTIGDIGMKNNELQHLADQYTKSRTINASKNLMIYSMVWLIFQILSIYIVFGDDTRNVLEGTQKEDEIEIDVVFDKNIDLPLEIENKDT
ncbi:hypothetical protein TRFO_15917 [Tritrichomonas foetus]|uniref:Uncharacterized protein n=1 Tax=Tritrichomonas foetus TaxID=1144522 RepID=A0A1J4KWH5_9EUKA|nr:hypothetical protein TRFO_15917 [Tritrichomonas foetus]|eukprot:OHT13885.1 hypothetical protein TRFO_15917 [Tritrichomonas foetus]